MLLEAWDTKKTEFKTPVFYYLSKITTLSILDGQLNVYPDKGDYTKATKFQIFSESEEEIKTNISLLELPYSY
jgi:hypothetical protein